MDIQYWKTILDFIEDSRTQDVIMNKSKKCPFCNQSVTTSKFDDFCSKKCKKEYEHMLKEYADVHHGHE